MLRGAWPHGPFARGALGNVPRLLSKQGGWLRFGWSWDPAASGEGRGRRLDLGALSTCLMV